ncbi:Hypothetical predicted protein, partial [Olea europaea subsp. europaea]
RNAVPTFDLLDGHPASFVGEVRRQSRVPRGRAERGSGRKPRRQRAQGRGVRPSPAQPGPASQSHRAICGVRKTMSAFAPATARPPRRRPSGSGARSVRALFTNCVPLDFGRTANRGGDVGGVDGLDELARAARSGDV